MCVACSPGIAALARGALGNLAAPSFAPAGLPAVAGSSNGNHAAGERSVILRGGPILTVDEDRPVAEALAIRGSRIIGVGSATDVKRHFTVATEILDLEGRAVLPGFVDPHVHVLESALAEAGDPAALLAEDPDRARELCASALREFASRGCTTVYDTGIGRQAGVAEHELLRTMARGADAPVRIRGALVPELARALDATPGGGDERYDTVGIAYWADGSLRDLAAALQEPYLGGRGVGTLNHEEPELREALREWHRAGWQLVVHSTGDRANEQVLRCFEEILEDASPAQMLHRIEHFALASDDQTARVAALGLALSHTIDQIYFCGEDLRDSVLGPDRTARMHALLRDVEHEICSSCHGGSTVDPLLSMRTAMTRLMRDSDDVLGPFQQLDLAQALRAVTHDPARQALLGDRVGMLRAGMLADLVVLDRDPREVAPERLHELRVLETWLGGRRQRWS